VKDNFRYCIASANDPTLAAKERLRTWGTRHSLEPRCAGREECAFLVPYGYHHSMKRCLFCHSRPTKPSAEHVFPQWLTALLPSARFVLSRKIRHDETPLAVWSNRRIDIKVKAVCENCNGRWMSDLESKYARPTIAEMILGLEEVSLNSERAFAICAFAFKTAVVVSSMANALHFFPSHERRRFASTLQSPPEIHVFVASYFGDRNKGGDLSVSTYESSLPNGDLLELYVTTWRAGHFAFQAVNPRIVVVPGARFQNYGFESNSPMSAFVCRIWPPPPSTCSWPPPETLGDYSLKEFCTRWSRVTFFGSN
jgi:hypothetical protein